MYITNKPEVALVAQKAGVDRIWVDMEYIGKDERQAGLDTVKSHHTVSDIKRVRDVISTSELMVRINPIHGETPSYSGTEQEIEDVIEAGAEVIMLPFFKTPEEVETFVSCVKGRAKTMILVETSEAVEALEEILNIEGIDEVHIGLNDLHLSYGLDFMFQLLADGTVERLCQAFEQRGLKYGFGGIARVGYGLLPAEFIITEHIRLGSTAAILSRDFCDANKLNDIETIEKLFTEGVLNIRSKEREAASISKAELERNHEEIVRRVDEIVRDRRARR